MAWTNVAGAAVGAIGAAASKPNSSSTSNKIDDRLAPYVYGKDGKGGLLGDVMGQYQQQFAQGGLNPMMRAGLESQRQVLASPQYTQGYDAMRSMGLGLMGAGVAQNPFTSGGMGGGAAPSVVRPTTNTQYQPFQPQQTESLMGMNTPIQSVAQYQATRPAPPPPPQQQTIDQMIEDYMMRMGLGRYSGGENFGEGGASPSGVHGGLGLDLGTALGVMGNLGFGPIGGMLGSAIGDAIGGSGNEAGNNGGMGLGSAMGGEGVGMGSAAGNGGDNGAEGATGGDGGDDGGDGLGFAKGGKVTKKRLKGPNPKGPDDGYAALDEGEYVINSKSAKRIGYDKLARMNRR